MIVLTTPAKEQSTYWITVNFFGEDDEAMAPDTCTWTLSDLEGNVINSREDVSISSPETSETIELSGDDLAIDGNNLVQRLVTLEGDYTSDTYGASKPFIIEIKFPVEPAIII